ncbi:MAG: DNA topoisomerase 4 subunit A [Eubacterium sp.]|nr:DNA topoisomerase 4 subunit A [Eubacterium sp.]
MSDQIVKTEYSEVMQKSYIDYAMSVICARALPDAKDGLKPVQRRVLYAMNQLHTDSDKPHRKSARIVGDTMGKYHPHGDSSIYETLVVLAQEFKKGMALVDGHGNFGSIEGDGAAAMRYTEARLQKFAEDVYLADLDKDIVDFVPNFDETEKEPVVLPVRVPNLLVNGAEGIAVGMATSIPTHNLGEVIDAVMAYMSKNSVKTEELLEIMPGPDFPTGGIVANKSELKDIYETGTGKLKLRGKIEFEKGKSRGHDKLVITEIPYTMIGAGISKFMSDVVELVENKVTNDIVDISNASDKDGVRIVLELKKGADIEKLKNMLYKKTKLEDTFGVNMLAIADGRPEVMGLKKLIKYYVDYQYELCKRKYKTLLKKAKDDKEIKEGLIKATNIIDLIIEVIRGSENKTQCKACLMRGDTTDIKFKNPESEIMASNLNFSERQAQAILDLRLAKLIGLEIKALEKEYQELTDLIAEYEDILKNKRSMTRTIKNDLKAIKKAYAKERKTTIEDGEEAVFVENEFVEQEVVFIQDKFGYTKLLDTAAYERNEESVTADNKYIYRCMNTDNILVFTNKGNVHQVKVHAIPLKKVREKGVPIDNLSNYDSSQENIVALFNYDSIKNEKLLFATKGGLVKIVDGSEFETNRKTMQATKLADGDELVGVEQTNDLIVVQTDNGRFLRFSTEEIPEQKKGTKGVKGINLDADDSVIKTYLIDSDDETVVKANGRKVELRKLKIGKRGAKGVKVRAGK